MLDAASYVSAMTRQLRQRFGDRLLYVGLQGSHLRGEATEGSDIDVMVVLSTLTPADMAAYRAIVEALPAPEKSCGFLCGQDDLARWNPLEITHLAYATRDCYGRLAPLLPPCTRQDVRRYVQLSAGNLYHELCHRRVHRGDAVSDECLPGGYRQAFFILQNLHYLDTGVFAPSRARLMPRLAGLDREVLAEDQRLREGGAPDPDRSFALLFGWCQDVLRRASTLAD